MEPIDLTASSDDEPGSGHGRSRKPNGFHNRNDGGTPRDAVDLTIDEPDHDPYLVSGTLSSPVPQSLQNSHIAPAPIPRKQEPSLAHPNGVLLQTHSERGVYTADASNVNFRANGPAWMSATLGPYRPPLAPATLMGIYPDAAIRVGSLGQGSAVRMPIDLAAPIAHIHLGPTTPTSNEALVARRSESVIPMHPHHQSPAPAQITPKINPADRIQLHAPNAAQLDKEQPPLQNSGASSGLPRNSRSSSPSRKADDGHASNLNTRLSDPGQSPELPLTIEFFQECLQKAIRDLRNDHQYYVKSLLPRARHHHSKPLTASNKSSSDVRNGVVAADKPVSFWQTTSPFADLKPLKAGHGFTKADDVGKLCQLGPKLTKQGPEVTIVPVIKYSAGNLTVPPYTNYISTKRNILIEDDKNRTFLPYYGDDAYVDRDYAELESRITRNRVNYHRSNATTEKARLYGPYAERFLTEVGCSVPVVLRYLLDETRPQLPDGLPQGLASAWRNRVVHLDDEYYDDSESSSTGKSRARLREKKPRKQWQAVFQSIPPPATSRESAAAGITCAVFLNMAGFSLWHVVRRHSLVTDAMSRKLKSAGSPSRPTSNTTSSVDSGKLPNLLDTYTDLGCLVCFAHECPGHGEFDDEDEEKNIRVRINAKPDSPSTPKRKTIGVQLVHNGTESSKVLVEDALGMDDEKAVSGNPWSKFKDEDAAFKDDELCSENCFWLKKNRSTSSSAWSEEDTELFNTIAPAYVDIRRGPCLIAFAVEKPCYEIFLKVLQLAELTSSTNSKLGHTGTAQGTRPAPRRHFDHWLENSITWEHHERPPFRPCNHLGACSALTNCQCFEDKVTCEKTCMCAGKCSRRYRGCTCAARGKVCWQNEKCDCYRLNRECDPDLCLSCGAHEVLDPANRYRPDITDGKCANVYVQRGIPRRTLLGHSKLLASGRVDGWGLYMGEATKKGDYIGEYVGEVISKEESEQRGIIYNKRNLSYLFDLNSTQTLDSTLVGNKFRYINHQAPPYANCQAKTLFCNTVHRIGMFACRNIEVGEEILFDYGEGFAAKFDLIKLDDNAQPKIEKRRKGVTYHKLHDKPPTLSKNGKRIGRPRKNAPSDQGGVKENVLQSAANTTAPAAPKKSRKRKRSVQPLGLDGVVHEEPDFEDALLSDDVAEEISSSDSFHESDDENARIRRRRRANAARISVTQKRGWRTKVGKRGGKRGRGGRPKTERGFGPAEKKPRGGQRGTRSKRGTKARAVKVEEVEEVVGAVATLQDLFHHETPRHGQKIRHPATEKGKEVDKGNNDDVEMVEDLPPDAFISTTPQKRGWQTRYANMGWEHKVSDGQNGGEGSSAAAFAQAHQATEEPPKRALKSYANMQKRQDVRSVLKHRRRG
ncbi:hypothetical protein MMC30_002416 [Trapelia coarctata]|nr:hypothetical protein [Trapelia coarctata]